MSARIQYFSFWALFALTALMAFSGGAFAGDGDSYSSCYRDADCDGVRDYYDKCSSTPRGTAVDSSGCPLSNSTGGGTTSSGTTSCYRDADCDGVRDYYDKCPGTPRGTAVNSSGCPLTTVTDDDKDGVINTNDNCPGTPVGATVDSTGCPKDTDNDRVYDGLDKCANTPLGATVDSTGCPKDADNDGVYDGLDQCPTQGSIGYGVNSSGCPNPKPVIVDTDGDGFSDGVDQCPTQGDAGNGVNSVGCPNPPPTGGTGSGSGNSGLSLVDDNNPDPAVCKGCHYDWVRFPQLALPGGPASTLGSLHHVPSNPVYAEQNCLGCHKVYIDQITGAPDISADATAGCGTCHGTGGEYQAVGSPQTTNKHHYSETFKNGSCHTCHVLPETQLTSSEICVTCHNGQVAKKDIVSSFNQPYSHPLDALGQSANGVQVSCLDCHNPNQVTSTNRLRGVQGVEPVWLGNWLGVGSFNIVASVEKQYQLCFKCHSSNTVGNKFGPNYATTPPYDSNQSPEFKYPSRGIRASEGSSTSVTLSGWDGRLTDQAKEFNPNNNSYHPVVAVGKNDYKMGTTDYSSSLINGWKPTSIMTCSDCHRDKDRPEIKGPHGSSVWPIASALYTGETGLGSGDSDSRSSRGNTFLTDMCFECHDRNVYGYGSDSSKDDGRRTGFSEGGKNLHYYHVEGKGSQCTTCHSAVPHGWKRKALLVWGAGTNPDPAPYNNHAKYPYKKDNTYSYGINSATPIDSIQSGQWRKEVCHDAGGGTGDCK